MNPRRSLHEFIDHLFADFWRLPGCRKWNCKTYGVDYTLAGEVDEEVRTVTTENENAFPS